VRGFGVRSLAGCPILARSFCARVGFHEPQSSGILICLGESRRPEKGQSSTRAGNPPQRYGAQRQARLSSISLRRSRSQGLEHRRIPPLQRTQGWGTRPVNRFAISENFTGVLPSETLALRPYLSCRESDPDGDLPDAALAIKSHNLCAPSGQEDRALFDIFCKVSLGRVSSICLITNR
jgi:hypothetical protein